MIQWSILPWNAKMWNIVTQAPLQANQNPQLAFFLGVSITPGLHTPLQDHQGSTADQIITTPSHFFWISAKSSLVCMTSTFLFRSPRLLPLKWITNMRGAKPLNSTNSKYKSQAHCMPHSSIHWITTNLLNPNCEPKNVLLAWWAAQKIKLWPQMHTLLWLSQIGNKREKQLTTCLKCQQQLKVTSVCPWMSAP